MIIHEVSRRFLLFVFIIAANLPFFSRAADGALAVSRPTFEKLATELAPKVNLFRDVWRNVPEAEFFGGTSRDYLYWLKGRLIRASAENRLDQEINSLRSMKTIDVREFILFESDVDVVAGRDVGVDGTRYGIKKIDLISAARFDPTTPEGQTEIRQGSIPVEKIRLSRNGFTPSRSFGDGVGEIYAGRPTVNFASRKEFASTHFAKEGLNHPVLLALRYLRLLGINYFQSHGDDYPDRATLFSEIDPRSAVNAKAVIEEAIGSGVLTELLKNDKFSKWLNATIQKAFRSYTNPTAAKMLFEEFGAARLPMVYSGVEPINQYLFKKNRDPAVIAANWKKFQADASIFESFRKTFPDGYLYHGSANETAFRSILFQGILPSKSGTAGAGLYGVASDNVTFAADWHHDERLVVMLELDPKARIVDIREGHRGHQIYEAYARRTGLSPLDGDTIERFAEAFGIDVVAYQYVTHAFVLTNADKIKSVQGWKRKLLKLDEIRRYVESNRLSPQDLIALVVDNSLSESEIKDLFDLDASREIVSSWSRLDGPTFLTDSKFALLRGSPYFFAIPMIREAISKSVQSLSLNDLMEPPDWLLRMTKFASREVFRTLHPIYFDSLSHVLAKIDKVTLESHLVEAYRRGSGLAFTSILFELERRAGRDVTMEREVRFFGATARSDRSEFDVELLKVPTFTFLKEKTLMTPETAMELLRLTTANRTVEIALNVVLFEPDHARMPEFLAEMARRPDGLKLLLEVAARFRHEHRANGVTVIDKSISTALESGVLSLDTSLLADRAAVGFLADWFINVTHADPQSIGTKTYLSFARFTALDHMSAYTFPAAIRIYLGFLKNPVLRQSVTGRQLLPILSANRGPETWWKQVLGEERKALQSAKGDLLAIQDSSAPRNRARSPLSCSALF